MSERDLWHVLVLATFAMAGVTFYVTGRMTAPYGRHERPGWGPGLPVRLSWVVMEAPSVFFFATMFLAGHRADQLVPRVFATMWLVHYVHRAIIYPMLTRSRKDKRMPVLVVTMGFVFNCLNSYINARSLTAFGPEYALGWLLSFRFLYGFMLFVTGFAINRWADWKLRRLRKPGETDYKIPRGGLYDEISCPNYFGEIVQWYGFAIATWSMAGFAFAAFTAANLIPRAVSHHQWYVRNFPDYPKRRRAVIPYLL
jgi:hypothetical protein